MRPVQLTRPVGLCSDRDAGRPGNEKVMLPDILIADFVTNNFGVR